MNADPEGCGYDCSVFVTSRLPINLVSEVEQAAVALGLSAVIVGDPDDGTVAGLRIDGAEFAGPLVERAHPNPADLGALVEQADEPSFIVADRISEAGREILRRHGWGWLDRRGHVRIWQPGVRVEAPFAAAGTPAAPRHTGNVWTPVGFEVALHALIHPSEPASARAVARATGRSVGATHELIARFCEVGLIGPTTKRPLLPDLFWETSARWPDDGWLALPVTLPEVAERLPTRELMRVDERAATLGGARIAAAGDLPARCYVATAASIRRLRSLASRDQPTRTFVRVAPVRWLPELDGFPPNDDFPWRVAHPILCALRLARDMSRGREIVEAWGIVPRPEDEVSE